MWDCQAWLGITRLTGRRITLQNPMTGAANETVSFGWPRRLTTRYAKVGISVIDEAIKKTY